MEQAVHRPCKILPRFAKENTVKQDKVLPLLPFECTAMDSLLYLFSKISKNIPDYIRLVLGDKKQNEG